MDNCATSPSLHQGSHVVFALPGNSARLHRLPRPQTSVETAVLARCAVESREPCARVKLPHLIVASCGALLTGLRVGRSRVHRRRHWLVHHEGRWLRKRSAADCIRRAAGGEASHEDEERLHLLQDELFPVLSEYLPMGSILAVYAAVRHRWLELSEADRPLLLIALKHLLRLRAGAPGLVAAALSAGSPDSPPSFGEGASLTRQQVEAAYGEKAMWLLIDLQQFVSIEMTVLAAAASVPLPDKLGLMKGHADLGLSLLTGQKTQSRSSESKIIYLAHAAARVRQMADIYCGDDGCYPDNGVWVVDTLALPDDSTSSEPLSLAPTIGLPERLLAGVAADVFAPLANLMGLGCLKDQLEDSAFALHRPEDRTAIRQNLWEAQTEEQLRPAAKELQEALEPELTFRASTASTAATLAVALDGKPALYFAGTRRLKGLTSLRIVVRSKSAYSIWKKMEKKDIEFDQVFDRAAMRLIVDANTVEEAEQLCFSMRQLVVELWELEVHREKDYISSPKANGYQSIHLQASKAGGRYGPMEIQIRSEEMHKQAEYGDFSHFEYKAGEGVAASDAAEAVGAELFAGMDMDGDGKLDAKELQQALGRVGVMATVEETEAMLAVFDTDRDGAVSFKDFWRALVTTWFPLVSGTHRVQSQS